MVVKWEKAFIVERGRAQEFVELYESMGYEVKVVNASTCDEKEDCRICYVQGDYVEILIRKKTEGCCLQEFNDL
jgi:hypothetical protein